MWREVAGYEGLYEVSDTGEVRSVDRVVAGNHLSPYRKLKGRIKAQAEVAGYKCVTLSRDGKLQMHKVHRLVARAFIPNPENKPSVNHKDHNRHNNTVSNLEWCTHTENERHKTEAGRRNTPKGSRSGTAKITDEDVRSIRRLVATHTQKEVGLMYGLSQTQVWRIVTGARWQHVL